MKQEQKWVETNDAPDAISKEARHIFNDLMNIACNADDIDLPFCRLLIQACYMMMHLDQERVRLMHQGEEMWELPDSCPEK